MQPADDNLLIQLKRGDERAFRKIYDRYKYSCYAVAYRYTQSEKLTEEMLTKLFSALWHQRKAIDGLREFLLAEMTGLVTAHLHRLAEERLEKKPAERDNGGETQAR